MFQRSFLEYSFARVPECLSKGLVFNSLPGVAKSKLAHLKGSEQANRQQNLCFLFSV